MDATLLSEVVQAVLDRGALSKDEAMDVWGLREEEYRWLQDRLADHPEIDPGPPGTGGFEARRRRGRLPDESASAPLLLRTEWEVRTVDRLVELLQHSELEALLGNLLYTLRQIRKETERTDRRGTKRELATALVLQHGTDLLAAVEVRRAVAHAAGAEFPRRWHPGKASAGEFVLAAGFPHELAGVPAREMPPDLEYLEGRFPLRPLLPFQREVQRASSILYFGPSVHDAECMAFLLRQRGIPAAVVSGSTREATRRQVVTEFKQGAIRVLCNCEVLTTGFDAPRVTHVVMARPTVSRVLYEQIVGRGLRGPQFGGTPTCVVVDCEDNYRGERPPLGYESFRRVWYGRPKRLVRKAG